MSILARAHYARKRGSNYEKFNVIYEKFNVVLKLNYEKFNVGNEKCIVFLILKYYLCNIILNQQLMDKRFFEAQLKTAEIQTLLAHISKNVNYKRDLEELATCNINEINATLSEVCQMFEQINQKLTKL